MKKAQRWESKLLDLCEKIISINSTNHHGNSDLALFVGKEMTKRGFQVSYQKAQLFGAHQANVIGRFGPRTGEPLLFNTHLDTVSTQPEEWTQTKGDPFRAVVKNGKLFGLGSADTKLALACQLIAVDLLRGMEWKRPLLITGTYGEEVGLIGVQKLIRSKKIRPAYVLNSEPTDFTPCNGNKGFRVYGIKGKWPVHTESAGVMSLIRFKGKAAHSAMPKKGVNAIVKAMQWAWSKRGQVGLVDAKGGLAPNIIAPTCVLKVYSSTASAVNGFQKFGGQLIFQRKNVDPLSVSAVDSSLEALLRFLRSQSDDQSNNWGKVDFARGHWDITLDHRYSPGVKPVPRYVQLEKIIRSFPQWTLDVIKDNPSFYQKSKGPLVEAVQSILRSMKKKTALKIKPGCTEASFFAAQGAQVLTIGPGITYGNAHEPNEHVKVRDLEKAVLFYREVIERMCAE